MQAECFLLQAYNPHEAFGLWLGQQEPYLQALLDWHGTEVQWRSDFQKQWVRARSLHDPANFLYECCDEGISVPLCQQPGYTFPSRDACEPPCRYPVHGCQSRCCSALWGADRLHQVWHAFFCTLWVVCGLWWAQQ